MWWISDQGVRFGIELDQRPWRRWGWPRRSAGQAPWPLIAVYAAGPALSRADAMTQHDSLAPVGGAEPLVTQTPGGSPCPGIKDPTTCADSATSTP